MSSNDMAAEHQRIRQSSSSNNNGNTSILDPQLQIEFWKNILARTMPIVVNPGAISTATVAPFNQAGAVAMLPHQQGQQSQLLQPPSINTNIRLPPAFDLTATIQHLLRASPSSPAAAFPQNVTFLLRQALFGQQKMAQIGAEEEEEEEDEEEAEERNVGEGIKPAGEIDKQKETVTEGGTDIPEDGEKSAGVIEPICLKMETELEGTACGNDPSQSLSTERQKATNGQRSQQQQQRRPRIGGSSAKTAEVWRYFSQRPNGEQAATCSICQKTIKAKNSSTTGMMRHLKSCHHVEYLIVQHFRILKIFKNTDETMRKEILCQLGYDQQPEGIFEMIQASLESSLSALLTPMQSMAAPTMVPKHSVEALINGIGGGDGGGNGMVALKNKDHSQMQSSAAMSSAFASQLSQLPAEQRQLLEQIENFKTSRPTSSERQQKKEQHQQQQIEELQKQGGGGKRMATNDEEEGHGATKGFGGRGASDGVLSLSAHRNGGIFREPKRRKEESASVGGAAGAGGMTPKGTTLNGKKSRKSTTTTAATTTVKTMTIGKVENGEKENGPIITNMAAELEKHSIRISEQMAAMFLLDKTDFLLDRAAFRHFIQCIMPNYQMPSSEQFRKEIIPRVQRQLEQLAMFREEFHRNNPFGLSPPQIGLLHPHPLLNTNNINSSSSSSSTSSNSNQYSLISPFFSTPSSISNNNSVISPSSSAEESGYHEEESPPSTATALTNNSDNIGHGQHPQQAQIHHQTLAKEKSLDVEELAQMAAIRSQNGSFTYSLDLNPLNGDGGSGTGPRD